MELLNICLHIQKRCSKTVKFEEYFFHVFRAILLNLNFFFKYILFYDPFIKKKYIYILSFKCNIFFIRKNILKIILLSNFKKIYF